MTAITLFGAVFLGLLSFGIVYRLASSAPFNISRHSPQFEAGQAARQSDLPENIPGNNINVPLSEPELTPWDGAGRVTILLLGLDYRDWEAGDEYSRSDTMILITLDPLAKKAGIMSIPRDLWVAIPGFQHGKINTAYYLGDAYKLPGGGPGLAVKTVEQFLGIPINYYAQIDFGAFVRFIDELGGVKINVPEPITVDLLGSGSATKKKLQPGVQVLPGEWALAYARARYTQGGDFDRAKRQQQVILAIRERILSLSMLPVLISKADTLYQELASGIHTNLTLDEAVKLAVLASQIPEENIARGVINEKLVLFGESPDNLSILIPLVDKVHQLRDEIFSSSGALGPLTPGSSQERMIQEGSRVAVLNGTQSAGLAERTAEYLRGLGVNVVQVGEAGQLSAQTTLIDNTGRPFTLKYLLESLTVNPYRVMYTEASSPDIDVEVILGNDWAAQNPLP
jgi:LCP family protein required for cell wall assembly